MKKNRKYQNIIINCVIGLLFVNLIIYILFLSKSLLNSDSAFIVDYAKEVIKIKSLFPRTWINTNDFWVYSLIPLISVFIKLGIKLIYARQIAVLIQTGILFAIIYDLYNKQLKDKMGGKIIILLLLGGISGQVFFEMYGDATYGSIVFYMFLELWLFIKYLGKKKNINLIFFGIVLTLITGCSLRFPIYIAAPLICCLLYFIYEKGLKKEYIKLFITIGIATVIGLMINKYINNALSILESIDRGLLNSKEELLTGLFNVIYNYFWLCGATNLNVYSLTVHYTNDFISSSSPLIVISFIRVIYAVVTFMLPFILFPKFNKFEEKEKYVFIYVISLKFLLLFFLLFCDMNYWYRYITPILIFENLLYPLLYKYYFSKTNKNKIVFSLAIIGFVFTSLFFVMTSTFDVKKKDFRDNKYQSVADILLKNDLHFGYTLDSNEHNIYSLLTNGNLQIIRINDTGTGPLNWLNSTEWFEEDYHKGRTFFIRKKSQTKIPAIESKAIDIIKFKEYYIFVLEDCNDVLENFE